MPDCARPSPPDTGERSSTGRVSGRDPEGYRIVPGRSPQTRDGSSVGSSAWLKPRRSKGRFLPVTPFRSGPAQGRGNRPRARNKEHTPLEYTPLVQTEKTLVCEARDRCSTHLRGTSRSRGDGTGIHACFRSRISRVQIPPSVPMIASNSEAECCSHTTEAGISKFPLPTRPADVAQRWSTALSRQRSWGRHPSSAPIPGT